jgi:hypothetical protein
VGSFYTNFTLRTTDQAGLRQYLLGQGLTAYISPPEGSCIAVFERSTEDQDPEEYVPIAENLSREFRSPTLLVILHDDDVLLYSLYSNGVPVDEYCSSPEYFGGNAVERGGDAKKLATAFALPERAAQVAAILALPSGPEGGPVFESERHERLVDALDLPKCTVGTGYTYLSEGEFPDGYNEDDFEHVGTG